MKRSKVLILSVVVTLFMACSEKTEQLLKSSPSSVINTNSGSKKEAFYESEVLAVPVAPSPVPMAVPKARVSPIVSSRPLPIMQAPNPLAEMRNEQYNTIKEQGFKEVATSALSTFSSDVDTASYANIRRYLIQNHRLPPKNAVRLEELLNYFSYKYQEPQDEQPFYINSVVSNTLWNKKSKILQIGLQSKKPNIEKLPPSNLVFLLDVSGSMGQANKLPLLKKSLALLSKQLREKDRVSIVVYAGNSGLVLDQAKGSESAQIVDALERLNAGGSTAGGQGIELAYKVAKEAFIEGGNNRVILATDGDFNVGLRDQDELIKFIEEKREMGIYLTVLGFGMGNYKDGKMEQLADKGNGNYAYIDNLLEAKKVLVTQMSGTLYTVAKDVKVQVEFNPKKVHAYRLIGYENRAMANEDFNNDKKDAGEIGMGHSVTALYEIILASENETSQVDELKYQNRTLSNSEELATVKIRYKQPNSSRSELMSKAILDSNGNISEIDRDFAQIVAGFGMILRDSEYKKGLKLSRLIALAKNVKGEDREGYRAEFIKLMEQAELLN